MTTTLARRGSKRRGKACGKRRRMTADERRLMQLESLQRAVQSPSLSNFPVIIEGFAARGIPVAQINPRENVFTFHAWRALGRTVRRGEKGLPVTTWAPVDRERVNPETGATETKTARVCRKAYVFHVSQTDPLHAEEPAPAPVHVHIVPRVAGLLEYSPA